jgi:alkaline phosphatase D
MRGSWKMGDRRNGAARGLSRRDLVHGALVLAAAGLTAPFAGSIAAAPRLAKSPFTLGVASGDPWPNGVVLWTRLALDLADGVRWGLSESAYGVDWEVRDLEAAGEPVVRRGTAVAAQRNAYAVHVEVAGLEPDRAYGYRFRLAGHEDGGITRTAPAPDAMPRKLRFAFCSCAEYENAFHYAYEFMAREDPRPQFIVHLGDYIYEQSYDQFYRRDYSDPAREGCKAPQYNRARWLRYDRVGKIRTLSQYRRRYGEYKLDRHLQFAHRQCPFIVTWDDHEVDNDYAGAVSAAPEEEHFAERRIAAYRAYFENMPIRLSSLPVHMSRRRLYRHFDFGRLMRLYMLDERQYRAPQACPEPLRGGGRAMALSGCPEIEREVDAKGRRREMLGREQEQWLASRLAGSEAAWNVLAQGVMMAHVDTRSDCQFASPRTEAHVWSDGWSGYMAARQRIVDLMHRHRARNPVVIGGDIHAHFVNRILKDWKDPQGSPAVAPEFVCTAVSSFVRNLEPLRADNRRSVVDLDCDHNGYVVCDVTRDDFQVSMMQVLPHARVPRIEEARAHAGLAYRVTAGDPEPRKV